MAAVDWKREDEKARKAVHHFQFQRRSFRMEEEGGKGEEECIFPTAVLKEPGGDGVGWC